MSKKKLTYSVSIDSKGVVQGAKEAKAAMGGVGASAVALGNILADVFKSAVSSLTGIVSESMNLFAVQEQAEQKLSAVLRATGEAAGFNAEELKKMAGQLQEVTTAGDEQILGLMSTLATFKSLKGDVFEATVEAALDLGEVFGSAEGAAIQLGKALEDPIVGMRSLREVGVTFSKQQKEQITQFVEANELVRAQGVVLDILKGQVGGVAREMAKTPTGQWEQLNNRIGDTKELIGQQLRSALVLLIPAFDKFIEITLAAIPKINKALTTTINSFQFLYQNFTVLSQIAINAAAAIGVLTLAYNASAIAARIAAIWASRAAIAMGIVTGGLSIIVAALVLLVGFLATSSEAIDGFGLMWIGLNMLIKSVFIAIVDYAIGGMRILWEAVKLPITMISKLFQTSFQTITSSFQEFVSAIIALTRGDFTIAFDLMAGIGAKFATGFIENVADTLVGLKEEIKNLGTDADFGPGVKIMEEGGKKMAAGFKDSFKVDMFDVPTLPALSDSYSINKDLSDEERKGSDTTFVDDNFIDEVATQADELIAIESEKTEKFIALTKEREEAIERERIIKERQHTAYMRAVFQQAQADIGSTKSLKKASKIIINTIASTIKAYIAEGIAAAVASALKNVPFPFNIAAAVAAGGLAATALNNAIPEFAEGGRVGEEEIVAVSKGEAIVSPAKATKIMPFLIGANTNKEFAGRLGEGFVKGKGHGTSDSVIGFVDKGSFVMNAESTKRAKPYLSEIFKKPAGFALGGFIGSGSGATVITTPADNSGMVSLVVDTVEKLINRIDGLEIKVRGVIAGKDIAFANVAGLEMIRETEVGF